MDAGKMMKIWGNSSRSNLASKADPIASLVVDHQKVFDDDSYSDSHCIVDFNEPGELCTRDQAIHNAMFYAVAYEVIPKLVSLLAGGLQGAANKVQLVSMVEKIDGIVGLFDRYAQHDKDCLANQGSEDQWEEDNECSCGRDRARGQLEELTDEFKKAVLVMCEEIDQNASAAAE